VGGFNTISRETIINHLKIQKLKKSEFTIRAGKRHRELFEVIFIAVPTEKQRQIIKIQSMCNHPYFSPVS
jgi:hypothetical protein